MSCLSDIYVFNSSSIQSSRIELGSIIFYDVELSSSVPAGYYGAVSQSVSASTDWKWYEANSLGVVIASGASYPIPLECNISTNPIINFTYNNATIFEIGSGFLPISGAATFNSGVEIKYPSNILGGDWLYSYTYNPGNLWINGESVEISGSGLATSTTNIAQRNNTAFLLMTSRSLAGMSGSNDWTLNVALNLYSGSDSLWGVFSTGSTTSSADSSNLGRYSLFATSRVPATASEANQRSTIYGDFSYESWIDWNESSQSMTLSLGYLTGSYTNTSVSNLDLSLIETEKFNLLKLNTTESQMITFKRSGSVVSVYQNAAVIGEVSSSWNPFNQINWIYRSGSAAFNTGRNAGLSIGETKWLWDLSSSVQIDYLVVAGGGGGGNGGNSGVPSFGSYGGGGGAGGYIAASGIFGVGNYAITVGPGGSGSRSNFSLGAQQGNPSYIQKVSGSTLITLVEAIGGGYGGLGNTGATAGAGGNGGSGGGGGGRPTQSPAGGTGTQGQGFNGGGRRGAGGGAAGPGSSNGPGTAWLDGQAYAIGGQGSPDLKNDTKGLTPDASGSGGGAGGWQNPDGGYNPAAEGDAGRNGIVKLRYRGIPIATGGSIETTGGYTSHTFNYVGPNFFSTQSFQILGSISSSAATNNTLLKGLQFSDIRGITLYSRSLSDNEIYSDYNFFVGRCEGVVPTTTTTTSTTTTSTTTTTTSTTTTLGPEIITRGLSSYLNFRNFFSASLENNDLWYDSVQLVSESACSRIIGIESADEGCGENRPDCPVFLSTGSFNAWDWPNVFNCNKSVFFPTGAFASSSNQTYVFYGAWEKDKDYGFVRNRNYQTSLQRANKIYSQNSNIVLESYWNNGSTHTLELPITASSFTSSSLSMLTVRVENGNTASVFQNGNLILTKETSSLNFQSQNAGYTYWLDSDDVSDYTMFAHSMLIYTASLTNNEISRLSTAINNNITGSY
jgi:hypothetical protein